MSISWMEIQPLSGYGDGSLNITVPINRNESRTCTIEVYSENITRTINITQNEYVIPTGLTVTPNPVVFPSTGGTVSVTLTAENDWVWVDWPDWVGISGDYYKGGSAGTHVIGLTVLNNTTGAIKTGEFSIKSGDEILYFGIEQESVLTTLSVTPTSISFPITGSSETITISSNTDWVITAPEWVTVSQASGNGDAIVEISTVENHSASVLSGVLQVSSRRETVDVQVSQSAYELLVSPSSLSFDISGGTKEIVVESSTEWTLTAPEWVTVSQTSGNGQTTVSVSAEENKNLYYMLGDIVFALKDNTDVTETVSVVQEFSTETGCDYITAKYYSDVDAKRQIFQFDSYLNMDELQYYWYLDGKYMKFADASGTIEAKAYLTKGEHTVLIPVYSTDGSIRMDDGEYLIFKVFKGYGADDVHILEAIYPESEKTLKIGEHAFSGCTYLSAVTLSNSVESIGHQAFYGTSSLRSIELTDSVKTIDERGFEGCSLTSVVIPDSVTSIGEYAFAYSDSLQTVVIGSGMTELSSALFAACSALTSVMIPDSVISIGFVDNEDYGGNADGVFAGCTALSAITIPDSVEIIGEETFWNCTSLSSVTMGSSVRSIGEYAFDNCSSLSEIILPSTLTDLGNLTFRNCTSLTAITCNAVTAPSLYANTFYNVPMYGKLYYPDGSDYSRWLSADAYYLGYYKWNDTYISISDNEGMDEVPISGGTYTVTVSSNTTWYIEKDDWITVSPLSGGEGETTVTMTVGEYKNESGRNGYVYFMTDDGKHTYTIGVNQEAYIPIVVSVSPTSLLFPSSGGSETLNVTANGEWSVTAPTWASLSTYGADGDVALTVSVSKNVSSDAKEGVLTFSTIDRVLEVQIVQNENADGEYTGNSVQVVYDITKTGSTSVCVYGLFDYYTINSGGTRYDANSHYTYTFDTTGIYTFDFYMKEGGTTITNYAFNTSNILEARIPKSIKKIDNNVFRDCTKMTKLILSEGLEELGSIQGCSALATITLPQSLTTLGNLAFSGCTGLSEIEIPSACVNVGSTLFYGLSGITVKINSDITQKEAFRLTKNVSVIFTDSVTKIPDYCFSAATGVTSVQIGNNVTTIGKYAFSGSTGISALTLPASCVNIGQYAFTDNDIDITVNGNLVNVQGTKPFGGGTGFTLNLYFSDSVTEIPAYVSEYSYQLKSVVMGKNVSVIGDYAFYDMSGATFTLSNSITSIGEQAFRYCKINEINLPEIVTIGDTAFGGTPLSAVTIGSKCTSMDDNVFSYCSNLSSITCNAVTAPAVTNYTFRNIKTGGTLYYPSGSDYSSWLLTSDYYLGKYNWTVSEI